MAGCVSHRRRSACGAPPLTKMTWPVMKSPRSRKRTASTTAWTEPTRPKGIRVGQSGQVGFVSSGRRKDEAGGDGVDPNPYGATHEPKDAREG